MEEYLTIQEVAARLKLAEKTIRNKMGVGLFRLGVHYFRPRGFGPRFKWSAIVELIESREASGVNLDPRDSLTTTKNGDRNHAGGMRS